MTRLLILSNGAGEDAIANKVLQCLPEDLKSRVVCCPLVGPGRALSDFEICGPRVLPPSEGLFRESWLLALKDLTHGVVGGHFRQLKFLRSVQKKVALVVSFGDLFPVNLGYLSGFRRHLFVGTAKSVYHHPYSVVERFLLRHTVDMSIVRDGATAKELMDYDLRAQWLGNAMMDEVQPVGLTLPFTPEGDVLTLFPGSRGKAPGVLAYQLDILDLVEQSCPGLQAGVAVAPGTDPVDLVGPSVAKGWNYLPGTAEHHVGRLERGSLTVHLLSAALGDLLSRSKVALGQAGTANEQAAGAGVPVVAYDPRGEKGLRWYRKRQKGLLGDAVRVVKEDKAVIAAEVQLLLNNSQEHARRAEIGLERMGPPGGCQRMAEAIVEAWPGL